MSSPAGSFEGSVREAVTRPADPLALDASGTLVIKPSALAGASAQQPYGVFDSFGSWTVTDHNWDQSGALRLTPQQVTHARGLRLQNNKIVPVEKGHLWQVEVALSITSTKACRVWACIEDLGPTTLQGGVRAHSSVATVDDNRSAAYPWTLCLSATGPSAAIDTAGTGFGTVQVISNQASAAKIVHMQITVRHGGRR